MEIDRLNKKKQRAKRDGNFKLLAEVVKELGDLYFETGQLTDALEEYTEQLEICNSLNDKLNSAVAHRMIGEVLASLGNYEEAISHQQQYLDGAQEVKNALEEQRALTTMGRTYFCLAETLTSDSDKQKEALTNAQVAFASGIRLCQELEATDVAPKELITMRARLLLNLGLVLDAQKKQEEAVNLLEKSAGLCEDHGLREDLYRTRIAFAGIYERQGDYAAALNYLGKACQIDTASLRAEASLLKSEVLLKAEKWQEARKQLVSMYVSDHTPSKVKRKAEKLLRLVVALQRTEEDLNEEKDPTKRLKLYETLGDAAVRAKSFHKAVHCYREMLRLAEDHDASQMGAALISLAQTLKDLDRHAEAATYARDELNLCTDPREICRSALFLADLLLDTSSSSDSEIRTLNDLAAANAKLSDDDALKNQVLQHLRYYFRSTGSANEAEALREYRDLLNIELGNEEKSSVDNSDDDEESVSAEIGDDICLDALSDVECELERNGSIRKGARRRTKRAVFKKNEKGETRLHVACISGNVEEVEKLLEQGHPVNVRDHFGWTPLHEAANHGFVDIARLLLSYGADVNDRGGPLCQGVTPLHDAASCGNVDMISFLLESGADVSLQTNDGDTAANCLEQWKNRIGQLSAEDLADYSRIYRRLAPASQEHGSDENHHSRLTEEAEFTDRDEGVQSARPAKDSPKKLSASEIYKSTIASLKHRSDPIGRPRRAPTTPWSTGPLLDTEQEVDWLEDDLKHNAINRSFEKSTSCERFKRKSSKTGAVPEESPKRQKTLHSELDASLHPDRHLDTKNSYETGRSKNLSTSPEVDARMERGNAPTKKLQTSLFSAGFTHSTVPLSPIEATCVRIEDDSPNLEVISFTALVDGKVFKIEVESEIQDILTVIEDRFFKETGCKASLNIKTIDGKVAGSKSIAEAVASGNLKTVACEVETLNVPPLGRRYETICGTHNIVVRDSVLKHLKSCENNFTLRLGHEDLTDKELELALRALEYLTNMQIIRLTSYGLRHSVASLNSCCAKFTSLRELHLSRCGLTAITLRKIECFPKCLRLLDLSYNPLGVESQCNLRQLLTPLQDLQSLYLQYCELEDFRVPLCLANLVNADLSWNVFSSSGFEDLMQKHLLKLSITGIIPTSSIASVSRIFHAPPESPCLLNLEYLEMAHCHLTDAEVRVLLSQAKSVTRIVLTGNSGVTGRTANFLLARKPSPRYVNLGQCAAIGCPPDPDVALTNPEICSFLANVAADAQTAWLKLWRETGVLHNLSKDLVLFKPVNEFNPLAHKFNNPS